MKHAILPRDLSLNGASTKDTEKVMLPAKIVTKTITITIVRPMKVMMAASLYLLSREFRMEKELMNQPRIAVMKNKPIAVGQRVNENVVRF